MKERKEKRRSLMSLIERADFKDKEVVIRLGKWILLFFLLFTELMVLLQQLEICREADSWWPFFAVVCVLVTLSVTEAVKLFAVKKFSRKIACYILDGVAVFLLTALSGSTYLSTLYMIILTEFYASSLKILPSSIVCLLCMGVYLVTYSASNWVRLGESLPVLQLVAQCFNALVVLAVHYLVTNFLVRFYRQYLRLTETLKELDESKKELQKAYDDLAEVTALEERQRIAKDIHDTAGHSITTVIMQTEAAKLILDTHPEEAKNKVIAANLQAKHALEELRESVHLLSGVETRPTLKNALLNVINETTDGTGIKIRWEIDEVVVSDAKYRFLSNTLKEGISNGLRHGAATAFWFELKAADGKLFFLLSDNGKGADMSKLQKGFGLTSMSEQAKRLGGTLELSSEEGEGLEIALTLPTDTVL